jgi:hypothetical protein
MILPPLSIYLKEIKNTYSNKRMFIYIHSHTISKTEKVKRAQKFRNRCIDKQIAIYTYNRILLDNKTE